MRTRARIDENQPQIVAALRKVGASVLSLAPIGKGCPDLLVGFRGKNFLMEIKNPDMPPSQRELTPDEWHFFKTWDGQKCMVETIEDAIRCLEL